MTRAALMVCMLAAAAACGGDDAGDGGDGPGDECPDFTRITGGTFARTATDLTFTLEVAGLPAELTFDQTDVPSFVEEYNWSVRIDVDVDGADDWEVAARHYKADSGERVVTNVLAETQNGLWRIDGALGTLAGSIDIALTGSTFTYSLPADREEELEPVSDASRFTWTTYHQFGRGLEDHCKDTFDGG